MGSLVSKYTPWFHDGDIEKISYNAKDYIIITLKSAQILDDDHEFDFLINRSDNQTIHGELHCKQNIKIVINDLPSNMEGFYLKSDFGTILTFEFLDSQTVHFFIRWHTLDNNNEIYENIMINANEFLWKNFN